MIGQAVLLGFVAVGFFGFGSAATLAVLLFRGYVMSNRRAWQRDEIRRDVMETLARERAQARQ